MSFRDRFRNVTQAPDRCRSAPTTNKPGQGTSTWRPAPPPAAAGPPTTPTAPPPTSPPRPTAASRDPEGPRHETRAHRRLAPPGHRPSRPPEPSRSRTPNRTPRPAPATTAPGRHGAGRRPAHGPAHHRKHPRAHRGRNRRRAGRRRGPGLHAPGRRHHRHLHRGRAPWFCAPCSTSTPSANRPPGRPRSPNFRRPGRLNPLPDPTDPKGITMMPQHTHVSGHICGDCDGSRERRHHHRRPHPRRHTRHAIPRQLPDLPGHRHHPPPAASLTAGR